MHFPSANQYARWRGQHTPVAALREGESRPPEKLLQAIWQQQRLRREQLKTLDGQSVEVLHPGFPSVTGGPDFQGAILRFGSAAPVTGDIEVDLATSGWRTHGHDRNPAFGNVILHVVWDQPKTTSSIPTIVAGSYLDAPLQELNVQLEHNSVRTLPPEMRGKCAAPLGALDPTPIEELLGQAAQVRLYNKAAQFRVRAQASGWEQAWWEGVFRALGYRPNVWPMLRLAELKPVWQVGATDLRQVQARLLGLGGLLPVELPRKSEGSEYVRGLWDCWWREREQFSDALLPRQAWRFHGLRPANQPQRRLALAAHWICDGELTTRLEQWCQNKNAGSAMPAALVKILQPPVDDFWSWHWTLKSVRLSKPQPLLGEQRITDLAVNVVLPWLLARAQAGRNRDLSEEIERRYMTWPAAEDNSVLRLARQRLLGRGIARSGLKHAFAQQGLLQIVRDFCDQSNSICEGCRFPELVQQFGGCS